MGQDLVIIQVMYQFFDLIISIKISHYSRMKNEKASKQHDVVNSARLP